MEMLVKLLTVAGLGAVELWAAIPAGLALQIHPLVTAIVAGTGAMLGVLAVLMLGEGLRSWLKRWHHGGSDGQHGGVYRIWVRWGVVGLGLLAPLLTGAPLGAALAVTVGAPRGRLFFSMALGIAIWSAILTLAGVLGWAAFDALTH